MEDVMLDIETLGVRSGCVILTIGAQTFSRTSDNKNSSKFYIRITQESCVKVGLHIDPNTLKWWNNFDDNNPAKIEALSSDLIRFELEHALNMFTNWFNHNKCKYVWAKGPDFDCVILQEAYRVCKMQAPWKYNNVRDVRTLLDLTNCKIQYVKVGSDHNAADDCQNQINEILPLFKSFK